VDREIKTRGEIMMKEMIVLFIFTLLVMHSSFSLKT